MQDIYSLVRKNSLYVLSGKLITPIINFLVTIYIIRMLSVGDYGIYRILLTVMAYIGLFSSLGLPSIFLRYIPELHERNELSNLKKLVTHGLFWRLILAVIIILCIFLFSTQIGRLLKIECFSDYFKVFFLGIIFFLEAGLLGATLTSLFLHKYFVISQVVYTLLRAGILYYLLECGWKLNGLFLGEVIAYGLLFILHLYFYNSKFSRTHGTKGGSNFPLGRFLRFGGFSYFNEISGTMLNVSADFVIISAFLGPTMVGIYAFANRITKLLSHLMPHFMFIDVIRPALFKKYVQTNNLIELSKMFNLLIKFIAFIWFPIVVGLVVLGDKLIIYVFDPKYLDALKVLWIVAAFSALNSFATPLGLVVQSIERVEINFYSKIFSIFNLIGDLLVVRPFGIIGVAVVTGTAILFKNLFIYLFAQKYIRLSVDLKSLSIISVNSLIMAVFIYFFRGSVVDVYSFFFVVLGGGLIYLLISYLNKGFSEDERRIVNRLLPKPLFVF